MNQRIISAILLLMLLLAGCLQVRDGWLPDEEPPQTEEPLDPEPGEPTDPDPETPDPTPDEPEAVTVSLQLPAGARELITDNSGNSVLQRIVVSYRPADDTGAEALLAGAAAADGAGTAVVIPGEPTQLDLLPGDYLFESEGYGGEDGGLLAVGSNAVSIDSGTASLDLALQPIMGSATLAPVVPTAFAAPDSEVEVRLQLWSAVGEYLVQPGGFTVEYDSNSGSPLTVSADSSRVTALAPAEGELTVNVIVRGLTSNDGVLNPAGERTAQLQLQVQSTAQAAQDWLAPDLVFDEVNRSLTALSGTASDDTGLASLRVFEGSTLLGSSVASDGAPALIGFSAGQPDRWTMDWTPAASGSHVLRAVATDLSGNASTAFRTLDVLPPEDEEDLATFTTVTAAVGGSGEGFDTNTGFCPANEFTTPGQGLQAVGAGLQAVGAIGGLLLAPAMAFESSLTSAAQVESGLDFVVSPQQHSNVTMIVVDDFGEGHYTLPAEVLTADVDAASLTGLAADGSITHGALVLHHTLQLFASRGYVEVDNFAEPNHQIQTVVVARPAAQDAGSFILRLVNTHGRDTSEIAGAIRQVFGAQPVNQQPSRNFVVNMSFVMLPCAVTADLEASGINTFEDYLEALAIINQVQVDKLTGLVTEGPLDDDLLEYLRCPFNTAGDCTATNSYADSIVHVASSGNFGSSFPLLPAAAPTVIAVSSQDAEYGSFGSRSGFSNTGSIMAPGANFELANNAGMTIAYAGTSFAAPVVSVMTAIDMSRTPPECSVSTALAGGMQIPELADIRLLGARYSNVPLHSSFAGGVGVVAAADFCKSPIPGN